MPVQRVRMTSICVGMAVSALALGLLPFSATPSIAAETSFSSKLTYIDCPADEELPPRTKCAHLTVPLDWQTPNDGRTLRIAMRITRAKDSKGPTGLTWNPGGPGGMVVPAHKYAYNLLAPEVRNRFDFISWDPRGVGKSQPFLANCKPVAVIPPPTGPVDWTAYWEEVAAIESAATKSCFEANSNAAPYLGTWQVVRDMDAMRAALGFSRWNYWGLSYGTRLGNAYARTFPGKLRALIEDSTIMANESIARFGATSPAGYHQAIEVYASLVGKKQAYKYNEILKYLNESVISEEDVEFNRWTFMNLVNGLAREQSNYAKMKTVINGFYEYVVTARAKGGQPALRALAREAWKLVSDKRAPRADDDGDVDDIEPDPDSDAFIIKFVTCADMADRPTPEDLAQMSRQAEQSYGTAYGLAVSRAALCFGLPSGYSPGVSNGDASISLRNPPLFLIALGDAATPWIWGRSLANTFAGSRTMTYDSTVHGILGSPSTCMQSAIRRYLLKLQLPSDNSFCRYVPTPVDKG